MPSRHGRGSVVTLHATGKRGHLNLALVALPASCVWILDLAILRGGTPHPLDDTWEYGLVARSLLEGHGFRTLMIHPPLWALRDAGLTVPVLVHGPLLSLLLAPWVALAGGASIDSAAWLAATFAVLAAVFTARAVARSVGGSTGALAAALVTLSPVMLRMVHHDIAPAAGACAVALVIDLLARPKPRPFAAGLVVGLGALVRPELLLLVPIVWWLLGLPRNLSFAGAAALVTAPWVIHTWIASGSPVFNLSSYMLIAYTPAHPGLSPLWDFALPLARWPAPVFQSLEALPGKWLHMAPRAIKHMLMTPGPGLGLFAAVGLLNVWTARATRRLGWAAIGAALIPFIVCTLTEPSERYVAVFLPLWAAGAAWGVMSLGGGYGRTRQLAAVLLLALLPFTVRAWTIEARQASALRGWLTHERAELGSRSAVAFRGRLMYSDTPDFAAWTTHRPTVAMTLEGFNALPDSAGATAAPPMRPRDPLDQWFHADVRMLPAPAAGGAARPL